MADGALVPPSQNDFINTLNQLTSTLTGAAQAGANVYSTFIGARTAANLANGQRSGLNTQPTTSELNAINAQRERVTTLITYGAVAVAFIGTAFLIYKAVK